MKEKIILYLLLLFIILHSFQPYGRIVGIVFSIIELALIISLLFIIQYSRYYKNNDINSKIVKLMSVYRHDFLNHLQVILGYASMKKFDQINQYVSRIYYQAKESSIISMFDDYNLAAYLYLIPVNFPKLKVDLELVEGIEVQGKNTDGKKVIKVLDQFLAIFHRIVEHNYENNYLYISAVGVDEKIVFILEFVGDIGQDYQKIVGLGEKFNKENVIFQIDLHSDHEFIIELHFPLK